MKDLSRKEVEKDDRSIGNYNGGNVKPDPIEKRERYFRKGE
jgi:hypothetical protein